MPHPSPAYQISLNGTDITGKINPRLVSLTLTEQRENAADQLDIVLDDSDGRLAIPPLGAQLRLRLGWQDSGMTDKGSFIVDQAEHSGAPDQLTLRARSAEMDSALRSRQSRSFHQTTVGAIVRQIAKEHQLSPKIAATLDNQAIEHIDQTNESDINFLNRLGKQYDAVATIKSGALLLLPINQRSNSQGQLLPAITLLRRHGDRHRYQQASRDAYSGVRAQWHDPEAAQEKSQLIGADDSPKRLRHVYASQKEAEDAAQAEWNRIERGKATLQFTLALGRPDVSPMMSVKIPDLKAPIGDTEWLIVSVRHSLSASGYVTELEMEVGQ